MEPIYVPIVVALIGGPVMWFLARFDKRNTEQHGKNMEVLARIENKQDRMDGKVGRLDAKVDRLDDRVTKIEYRKPSTRPQKKSV